MLKIAVFSDIHIGRRKLIIYQYDRLFNFNDKEAVVGKEIERRLEMAVRQINKQKFDFTVIAGDITESGDRDQFLRAAEILNNLERPLVPLMGNHDLWPFSRNENGQIIWQAERQKNVCEFESYFNDGWKDIVKNFSSQGNSFQNYVFTFEGVRFIVVDNLNRRHAFWGFPGTSAFPKLHQKSREWLREQLISIQEEKIIIFSHAVIDVNLLKRLTKMTKTSVTNVCGHSHKSSSKENENIRVLKLPAFYLSSKILEIELGKQRICFFMNQISSS